MVGVWPVIFLNYFQGSVHPKNVFKRENQLAANCVSVLLGCGLRFLLSPTNGVFSVSAAVSS